MLSSKKWPDVITQAQQLEKSSEEALDTHNTVFIAVDEEIGCGPLLLSDTNKVLTLSRAELSVRNAVSYRLYRRAPHSRRMRKSCKIRTACLS